MDGPEARVRAAGRRLPYEAVPEPVRAWVTRIVGAVAVAREHRGGMSPGCATSLRTTDGSLSFVKAVKPVKNGTPEVDITEQETEAFEPVAAARG